MDAIRNPETQPEAATRYWGRYFSETPLCAVAGCGRVAQEVDAFFPYIDDYNRCDLHEAMAGAGTIH